MRFWSGWERPKLIDNARLAWQVWRRERLSPAQLANYQQERFQELVNFARHRSRFYTQLYRDLPEGSLELSSLPPVNRPQLLANFDDWVTDGEVTRADVDAFSADYERIGQLYLGRYAVWKTSATTGAPGTFLYDRPTLAELRATQLVRMRLRDRGIRELLSCQRRGWRTAVVGVIGPGRPVSGSVAFAIRQSPWLARRLRNFSSSQPLGDLIQELNEWQPIDLQGAPYYLEKLAEQQLAGRLRIKPSLIICGGEALSPTVRKIIRDAFGCAVREQYAATDLGLIASECRHERLHLHADRLICEPVDERNQPVAPGQLSERVLVTHLAGRIAPLIRYELDDRIRLMPEACPCGRVLPVIQVEGRVGEPLCFRASNGAVVRVGSSELESEIKSVQALTNYQLIQIGPASLALRFVGTTPSAAAVVVAATERCLRAYLSGQGLDHFEFRHSAAPPQPDPRSGKLRKVLVELAEDC